MNLPLGLVGVLLCALLSVGSGGLLGVFGRNLGHCYGERLAIVLEEYIEDAKFNSSRTVKTRR